MKYILETIDTDINDVKINDLVLNNGKLKRILWIVHNDCDYVIYFDDNTSENFNDDMELTIATGYSNDNTHGIVARKAPAHELIVGDIFKTTNRCDLYVAIAIRYVDPKTNYLSRCKGYIEVTARNVLDYYTIQDFRLDIDCMIEIYRRDLATDI